MSDKKASYLAAEKKIPKTVENQKLAVLEDTWICYSENEKHTIY